MSSIMKISEEQTRQLYEEFATVQDTELDDVDFIQIMSEKYGINSSTVGAQRHRFRNFKDKGGDIDMFIGGTPRKQCFVTVKVPKKADPKPPSSRKLNMLRLELASAIHAYNQKIVNEKLQYEAEAHRISNLISRADGATIPGLIAELAKLKNGKNLLKREGEKLREMLPHSAKQVIGQNVSFMKICQTLGVDHEESLSSVMFRNLAMFITEEERQKVAELEAAEADFAEEERKRIQKAEDLLPPHLKAQGQRG